MTTPAERRRILRRWDDSGLSAHDFGPVVGVPVSTLYSWRKRDRSAPTFVELALAPDHAAAPAPTEIALPRGLVVRVDAGFDPDTLRRAVDVILAQSRDALCPSHRESPKPVWGSSGLP